MQIKRSRRNFGRSIKINQGNIIYRPPVASDEKPQWGFIITADCDIFNNKAGSKLSYLEIITARDFLERVWAQEILRRMRDKALHECTEFVTKAAQDISDDFDPITNDDLLEWLTDTSPEQILEILGIPEKKRKPILDGLKIVEICYGIRSEQATPLARLTGIWSIKNQNEKSTRARLEEALNYNQANDFHIIPEIPGFRENGFIVLLREIKSIFYDDIFSSALELQISGSNEGYHMVGTSSDNLRYAVSQKMAFLFSRIGMNEEFESLSEILKQITVDEVFRKA